MDNIFFLFFVVLVIGVAVGMYKTFSRMGYDDAWWIFVPILNMIFVLKVINKPMWLIVLAFLPIISLYWLYLYYLLSEKVATAYGKGTGYAFGLLFLGFIFYPLLGFGSEEPQLAV
ncbi:MAG TPA: DUF5684 domain-containing protein [Planctomycetota bacterium]|nr:DUF5684 domain-containing protein [Planctomycetota bacterium]